MNALRGVIKLWLGIPLLQISLPAKAFWICMFIYYAIHDRGNYDARMVWILIMLSIQLIGAVICSDRRPRRRLIG